MEEDKIIQKTISPEILHSGEDSSLTDVQVSTAKQYPRDIQLAIRNSMAIATLDQKTAESCNYSLPRGGKQLSGPSVHLARIMAQNWGNLRAEARVVEINEKEIVSEAICWDLESNYAVKIEVRRRITDKYGKRFNDDMITVTGNAANAISYRNAVFAVIPKGVYQKVYDSALNLISGGDNADQAALNKKRDEWFDFFKKTYKLTEDQLLKFIGVKSKGDAKKSQIVHLSGTYQAIKNGDTTPELAFEHLRTVDQKKKYLKNKSNETPEMP